MFGSLSFGEIAIAGITLIATDMFIEPFFAGSEMLRLFKFFIQAWIVLYVDQMVMARA